ncbi:hypothetical protein QJS10_CPA05g00623 [Acorus calamus]|uniref:GrpE protein homolog n=1 Tax=Acorus calamus TaxID=4465 RepID=A0AAV9ETS1_ACOCL|nr:hypothetical protein QJS10_CPA05g00623 [Acorus calamus]
MATILKSPQLLLNLSSPSFESPKKSLSSLSFKNRPTKAPQQPRLFSRLTDRASFRVRTPPIFSAHGEVTETEEASETVATQDDSASEVDVEKVEDDGAVADVEEKSFSAISIALQSYREALTNDDKSTISEIESFLLSVEDDKNSLASKVAALSEESSVERERVLRISADFDNFRKRTERERLSVMENAQGEVVESLLAVLDNFERAKAQIKVETEGEEKINNSYQSIYKQFSEILSSLGVVPVETVGNAFDPLFHEAIMREDSEEYEEGIIIQEFRKGFKLGDRLLRPSMVKVSAGPGPAKSEESGPPVEGEVSGNGEESSDDGVDRSDEAAS